MTTTNDTTTALEHQVGPRGRFLLRQSSGEVAIRGAEGERVRVRSLDGRPLADRFTIDAGEGSLEIRQIEGLSFSVGGLSFSRKEGAELAIEVPHGATVSVDTQSADIQATDLSGTKKFRTASGEVTLSRLAGALDVDTVSGEIELDGQAPVDLVAKSVSGDIRVRVPSLRRLDIGTTSGDIRLDAELAGDGPFAIRSISGDATIVGRGAGFRVEAESITGDLSSDLPSKRESMPGRKVLTVGRPGPTLSFRSVSGDFHVAGPRDAAPDIASPTTVEGAPPVEDADAGVRDPDARDREVRNRDQAIPADVTASSDTDPTQLDILRALERGEISVAVATEKLSRLDEVLR